MAAHKDVIKYKWTAKDQLDESAKGDAKARVTPYRVLPGAIPKASKLAEGDEVSFSLGLSGEPWAVNRFFLDGCVWEKIPEQIPRATTIEDLCKALLAFDRNKYMLCDMSSRTALSKNDFALLLFDYWENTDWRYEIVHAGFDWSVLKEKALTVRASSPKAKLCYVPVRVPPKAAPIHATPTRKDDAPPSPFLTTCKVGPGTPAWLCELMTLLSDLAASAGWQRNTGLAAANDTYKHVVQECSKSLFYVRSLLDVVRVFEAEIRVRVTNLQDPQVLGIKHVRKRLEAFQQRATALLGADVDDSVENAAPGIRGARIEYTLKCRAAIANPRLTELLKQLVAEQAKTPPDQPSRYDDYVECAAIVLEFAYSALIYSPNPEEATAHVMEMIDHIGSKPIDPAIVALVEDKRLDLSAVEDPGIKNPLSVLASNMGTRHLRHTLGMAGTLIQHMTFVQFPNVLHDKSLAKPLASKFLKTLISVADGFRKNAIVSEGRWVDPMGPTDVVKAANSRSGVQLTVLESKLGGISYGRFGKTFLAVWNLYMALDALERDYDPSAKIPYTTPSLLGLGAATLGTINCTNKILGTWGAYPSKVGVGAGRVIGGLACLMSMAMNVMESQAASDRGDIFGVVLEHLKVVTNAAGFASFIAYDACGCAWGPPGMTITALAGLGLWAVGAARDAATPGGEKLYRGCVERMRKDDCYFQAVPELKRMIKDLADDEEILRAFWTIELYPSWRLAVHPDRDWAAQLAKAGLDKATIQAMTSEPSTLQSNPWILTPGSDPMWDDEKADFYKVRNPSLQSESQ